MEHKIECFPVCQKEEIISDIKSDIDTLFNKTTKLGEDNSRNEEAIKNLKNITEKVEKAMNDLEKTLQKVTNQMYWTAGKIAGGVAVASILIGFIIKKLMEVS